MLTKLTSRLTYSNLMASVAVFIALGGGAYALSVPAHSIGAKQLKRNAATAAKIKNGAVASAKVRDDSLTGADILESSVGQVPSAAKADSATSADSAKSADLAQTAASATMADAAVSADTAKSVADSSVGAAALKTTFTVDTPSVNVPAGASNGASAFCPAGSQVIGGGLVWEVSPGVLTTDGDLLHLTNSFKGVANSWVVVGGNATGTARTFHAQAYCLPG
jgi:hypothetical protein